MTHETSPKKHSDLCPGCKQTINDRKKSYDDVIVATECGHIVCFIGSILCARCAICQNRCRFCGISLSQNEFDNELPVSTTEQNHQENREENTPKRNEIKRRRKRIRKLALRQKRNCTEDFTPIRRRTKKENGCVKKIRQRHRAKP